MNTKSIKSPKSILVAFAILLGLLSQSVKAYDFAADGFYFNLGSKGVYVTYLTFGAEQYGNLSGEIKIPSTVTYQGLTYTVTGIGEGAFAYCTSMTSVIIPNTITFIEHNAFDGCRNLTSVTIPNSVTTIGPYAFQSAGLTTLVVGNSVTSIGERAFSCSSLKSVTWNATECDNFKNEYYAPFNGNNNITSFTIGNEVKTIPSYLCYKLTGLTSINLPNSVTRIASNAFSGCTGLTSVTIPNSVTNIRDAFAACTSLKTVRWNIRECEDFNQYYQPFKGDNNITSFIFGDEVEKIPAYLCYDLTGLASLDLPNSITQIGSNAFSRCTGLTSVTIPYSLTNLSSNVFSRCTTIKEVKWNAKECGNFNRYEIPFKDSNNRIASFTFGDKVETIPAYLCYNMTCISSVNLPNSVKTVGEGAFLNCISLTTLNIPLIR